jgi:hypothetical protein
VCASPYSLQLVYFPSNCATNSVKEKSNYMQRLVKAMAFVMLLSGTITAQGTRPRSQQRRAPRASESRPVTEILAGANKIADQLKLLNRFIYVYGRLSVGLETAEDLARRGEATDNDRANTERSKASIRDNLKNIREGLDLLEIHFRSTPSLNRYYMRLAGVAASAAAAEELAAANQFDRAGRSLLESANRLADVQVEMLR